MFTTFHHIYFDTLRRAFHNKTNECVFINIDKVRLKFDFSQSVGGVRAVFNIFLVTSAFRRLRPGRRRLTHSCVGNKQHSNTTHFGGVRGVSYINKNFI